MMQRAITTLLLNNCWNQMYQDLCYLLIVSRLINIIYILAWYKKQKWKMQALTLPGYILHFVKALYFSFLFRIICTMFICLVVDGLFQSICFRMFCSEQSITFENTYLLDCLFHCVEMFYIKFRFCETFTVTNSMTKILLIQILSNLID